MTRDGFNSLVAELALARSGQPRELLRETLAWIVLGYAVLLAALSACALLALAGLLIALQQQGWTGTLVGGALAFAGLLTAVLLVCCLWVKFDPPEGAPLDEEEHPELHRLIRETGNLVGGVRFHQVLLDAEVNAATVQNPRLGVLGWYRSYLVIGLPLMEMLSREEFRAVLAHEFAHAVGPDGRTRAWLHRKRATWEKVAGRLPASPLFPLLSKFFRWFWPRFNSRAFLLSRFHELEADRVAAEAVSAEALASGLQRLAIQGLRLEEEFWQPLESAIAGSAAVPRDVIERLSALVRSEPPANSRDRWTSQAMGKSADFTDTHPALAERLAHLGIPVSASPLLIPATNAADELLDAAFLGRARQHFSTDWSKDALAARRDRPAGTCDAPGVRDAWKRIAALSRLDGLEKVQGEVLALLERRPDHSGALYLRGCHLAEKGDLESAAYLERAAADPTIASRAFETLARFHSRLGNVAEIDTLKERAEQHQRELRAALVERSKVCPQDSFLPHDLGESELERLREALATEPAVRRAWLGAKHVTHFPGWKLLVLVVDARWPAFKPVSERMQQQLLERLLERWEIDAYVQPVRLDEDTKPVLKAIRRRVADSEVYRPS
ncbi:M48 family metalloprotease [Luteolibacter sp. Populi]|uniref:M48 family metalloprotease n=1 Tax=Luteolibacter sp. Populi TaxID=3230487 RepID=UPI0034670073